MDFERSIESRLENGSKRVQMIKRSAKKLARRWFVCTDKRRRSQVFKLDVSSTKRTSFWKSGKSKAIVDYRFAAKLRYRWQRENLTWRKVIQLPGEKVTRQPLFGVASKLIKT